jgi:DNA-binding NarL/FixJ family response regulator
LLRPSSAGFDRCFAVTVLVVLARVRLYRDGLAELFASRADFTVAATAAVEADGLELIRELGPDIVLLALDPGTGASLVREIVASVPETRVVAIGIADDDPEVLPLAEAGVAGYVTTDASAEEVVGVVESVARGEALCSPRISATLLQRVATLSRGQRLHPDRDALTAREREIVELIDHGLSNKEIARRLQIEVATVKNHVHHILEKLHVARRGEAAALLRRS